MATDTTMGSRALARNVHSVDSRILERARSAPAGWVFTPRDFLDLGSRAAVDQALSRQARHGSIRKVARGLYEIPRRDPQLGQLAPSLDAIAQTLQSRDAVRLQPSGAYAANALGLSDQVPMKVVFLTDGSPRRVQVGRLQICLRRTTPRNMATAGRVSGLVIQALRHLGEDAVGDREVDILRRRLTAADRQQLLDDARYAPAWVARVMQDVAAPAGD